MIDLRQMRYFVAIVEHGSFSRAAEYLHVAQPALSLHVRNMETDLGTALLFRSPRGVVPTEAGVILLRHARIMLDQVAVAEEEIRGHQREPSGDVRLGLPATIGQILAVPLLTQVHTRYPKIRLRIAEAMSGYIQDWLREGRIDLAVLYGEASEHAIRTEALLDEPLTFFGTPDMLKQAGLTAADLPLAAAADMPLILPGEGHGLRDLIKRHATATGCALTAVIDVDSYQNIKDLVLEGLGFSILPQNAIAAEVAEGKLASRRLTQPSIRRTVHLAYSTDKPMTNAVAVVRTLARAMLCDLARTGRWSGADIVMPGADEKDD
ncbi:LysR family transcriptional regulator [Haematobacter massiliensis]|uniref:LysR family transcriptional regulator n=1 Tax=Haematobacter massiliensis TaxID=195105 RepID=UPI00068C7D65|nr:LysR substrate-binding domain-containing protein [Haematobacter massiliensis]OWJ73068.1 LysR family transcriptional regulator [Haematobacter massiliensis]OWJ88262.1 LysR family transcriptional regulator [Haematobacter massiliensis]QBJ25617.1 LysR family transcriptional regulator [Haematobacter massiliensis]